MIPAKYPCPHCGTRVFIADTRPGFCIPVDCEPVDDGTYILTLNTETGELKAEQCEEDWTGRRYQRHTCEHDLEKRNE